MRFHKGPGGILFALDKEEIPPCPEGYEQDTRNPRVFLPKYPACNHREMKDRHLKCQKDVKIPYCNAIKLPVKRFICVQCKGSVEWILNWAQKSGSQEKDQV